MTTWTVETVQALAKELQYISVRLRSIYERKAIDQAIDGVISAASCQVDNAASALTWALEEIRQQKWRADNFAACFERQQERAAKAEAERDAANARAERARNEALEEAAAAAISAPRVEGRYDKWRDPTGCEIATRIRALKTQEASK